MKDRNDEKCDCLNDCEMVHFFSTMQKEAFNKYSTETRPQHWFDKGNKIRPPSGILANYLLDPENIFSNQLAKNLTKLANNMSLNKDLAEKRFYEVNKKIRISIFFSAIFRYSVKSILMNRISILVSQNQNRAFNFKLSN